MESSKQGRVAIRSDEIPYPSFAPAFSSPAILAGGWLFCSGVMSTDFDVAVNADGYVDPASLYRSDSYDAGRLEAQSHGVLRRLESIFTAAGGSLRNDTLRVEQFFRSPHPNQADFDSRRECWAEGAWVGPYVEVRDQYIDEARPSSVGFGVNDMVVPGIDLQIDMIGAPGVEKTRVEAPEGVPQPVAGYSPGIRYGDWVSLSGEVATDWKGDWMSSVHMGSPAGTDPQVRPNEYFWYGDTMELQVDLVLRKQQAIAEAAGASIENCVSATCYIGHPADFFALDRAWKRWFPENPPARTVIPYAGLGGKGWRFECTMDFLTDDATISAEHIETDKAPTPFGHESQAVRAGSFLFFGTQRAVDSSGVLSAGVDPAFGRYVSPGRLQMAQILGNLAAISEAAGSSLDNICRLKLFVDDWDAIAPALEELAVAFPKDPPAVSLHRVNGSPMLAPGCNLLVDAIGFVP
jgi:enamine deaminase RidA (YjgF/YER057c/UK114 family)